MKGLFQPALRMPMIVGLGLAVFQQITGINTVIYYAPTIFKFAGIQAAGPAILAGAGLALVMWCFHVLAIFLMDRVGRRPLLLVGVAGQVVGLAILGAAFQFRQLAVLKSDVAIGGLVIYVACFAFGLGPIFWLLISEIYPLKIRGAAMSAVTVTNWGLNLAVAVTFLTLVGALGHAGTFWLYGAIAVGAWVFFYRLVPETKGKTLEQIEAHWRSEKSPRANCENETPSAHEASSIHLLPVGRGHAPAALLGAHRRQLPRPPRSACRLAGTSCALPRELGFRHVRFHGLLCDDMGTLVRRARPVALLLLQRRPDHGFPAVDRHEAVRGVELHADGARLRRHDHLLLSRQRDAAGGLRRNGRRSIRRLATHWVERYGVDEVRQLVFRGVERAEPAGVLGRHAERILRAVPAHGAGDQGRGRRLRVGGPATAANAWLPEFLDFCEQTSAAGSISSARTTIPTIRSGATARTPRRNWPAASAASCASGRRRRAARRAAGRSTTPSGTPRRTRATRCRTSPTRRPSSSRPCWR